MKAIQVNWTIPRKIHVDNIQKSLGPRLPVLGEWDTLYALLSVRQWQKMNGEIVLYTDSEGARLFEEHHILDLWDDVNTSVLDAIDTEMYDPEFFWCTPKFLAFQQQPEPFVYMDLDLIAWEKIDPAGSALRFLHWEIADPTAYNTGGKLQAAADFVFSPHWNMQREKAFNVACLYFGNNDFKEEYCRQALSFMKNNKIQSIFNDPIMRSSGFSPEILFAEQTLLDLLVEERGISAKPFIDAIYVPGRLAFVKDDPFLGRWHYHRAEPASRFTHLWMYKHAVKLMPVIRSEYVRHLIEAVLRNFPGESDRLVKLPGIGAYLDDPVIRKLLG